MSDVTVLGVDLASRRWEDCGTAVIRFTPGTNARWRSVEHKSIDWPDEPLTPQAMARAIHETMVTRHISAVSLDGPHGWRAPVNDHPGVGRLCEYEARCQGKTGELGITYPQNQSRWSHFCIDLFAELQRTFNAQLANQLALESYTVLTRGDYWLLESYPTATWKQSQLKPLPSKARVGRDAATIAAFARELAKRFELPDMDCWHGTHDNLQAVVAALPAAGLLGGPCRAAAFGKPGWQHHASLQTANHFVEGLIWYASPTRC